MNNKFIKKQLLCFVAFLLFTSASVFSQKGVKDHVITITPTSLLGTKLNLGYEYTLNSKMGLKLGYGLVVVNETDGLVEELNDGFGSSTNNLTTNPKFKGFDITPELRFYTGGNAAENFYIGPFLRYYKYKIDDIAYDFEDGDNIQREGIATTSLSAIGGGFILGGQWISDAGFTFGVNLGLGGGLGKIKAEVSDISGIESGQGYKDLEQDFRDSINEDLDGFPIDKLGIYSTNNSVGIETDRFLVPIFRFGLALGWAF